MAHSRLLKAWASKSYACGGCNAQAVQEEGMLSTCCCVVQSCRASVPGSGPENVQLVCMSNCAAKDVCCKACAIKHCACIQSAAFNLQEGGTLAAATLCTCAQRSACTVRALSTSWRCSVHNHKPCTSSQTKSHHLYRYASIQFTSICVTGGPHLHHRLLHHPSDPPGRRSEGQEG